MSRRAQTHSADGLVEHLGPDGEVEPARRVRGSSVPLGLGVTPLVLAVDLVSLAAGIVLLSPLGTISASLVVVMVVSLNAVGGHYRARLAPSVLDDLPGLVGRALVSGALVTALLIQFNMTAYEGPLHLVLVFVVLATLGRAVGYWLVRSLRRVGRVAHPTIIMGAGKVGDQIARTLKEHPEYGLWPVGFIDDDPFIAAEDLATPLLGGTDRLAKILSERGVRNVIVAFSAVRESVVVDVLRTCDRLSCEIFLVPRLYELHASERATEMVWGLPLLRLRRAAYRTVAWQMKRVIDVLVAGFGIVVLLPVLTVCAIAVRLEGGSGIIFRQQRVGLDGRPFTLLKFRSLRPANEDESASRWNVSDDDRVGPVGRLLRRSSLDELPQLWNVLRGDMSLVGPRPERPFFVDSFSQRFPRYMARHRVPAGITGWAQVNGLRGDTSIADRARFDNYYVENWSLWTDVKIMLRTVAQVVGFGGR